MCIQRIVAGLAIAIALVGSAHAEVRKLLNGKDVVQVVAGQAQYFALDRAGGIYTGPIFESTDDPATRIDDGRPTRMIGASYALFRVLADGRVSTLTQGAWVDCPAGLLMGRSFERVVGSNEKVSFVSTRGEIWRKFSSRYTDDDVMGDMRLYFDGATIKDVAAEGFELWALTGDGQVLDIVPSIRTLSEATVKSKVSVGAAKVEQMAANASGLYVLTCNHEILHATLGRVDTLPESQGTLRIACEPEGIVALTAAGEIRRYSQRSQAWTLLHTEPGIRAIQTYAETTGRFESLDGKTAVLFISADGSVSAISDSFSPRRVTDLRIDAAGPTAIR